MKDRDCREIADLRLNTLNTKIMFSLNYGFGRFCRGFCIIFRLRNKCMP